MHINEVLRRADPENFVRWEGGGIFIFYFFALVIIFYRGERVYTNI